MDFTHFTAGKDDDDRRLDRIIRRYIAESSLSNVYKSLRTGLIKLNGKKCEAGSRVHQGDDIAIAAFLCKESSREPAHTKALDEKTVLFRNEHLLIVNKPYDIPVQPAKQGGAALSTSIAEDYAFYHTGAGIQALSFRAAPLHRLDRKTTGIVCASQSLAGARWFTETMQAHLLQKHYIALVTGDMREKADWTDGIQKNAGKNDAFHTVTVGSADDADALRSVTHAIPLAYGSYTYKNGKTLPVTLAQFSIETGRTHQIRAQAAFHGFPLLGDSAYGSEKLSGCGQDFFLHAYELHFPENTLGIPMVVNASISTFFQKMLGKTLIKWNGRLIL